MWQRLFYIVAEAGIIALSAIIGTFAWNHFSPIYNSMDWGDSLMKDIAMYWQAYLAIGVLFLILVVILYFKAKREDNKIERKLDNLTAELHLIRSKKDDEPKPEHFDSVL